ncbi:MAG TPA: hypothetical protein VNJ46_02920 [Gaiellaceae bacterium]|nr:hypothetical protein [Gaiellaceae bacterium]
MRRTALVLGVAAAAALGVSPVATGARPAQATLQVAEPAPVRPALARAALARPAVVQATIVHSALVESARARSQRARAHRSSALGPLAR